MTTTLVVLWIYIRYQLIPDIISFISFLTIDSDTYLAPYSKLQQYWLIHFVNADIYRQSNGVLPQGSAEWQKKEN